MTSATKRALRGRCLPLPAMLFTLACAEHSEAGRSGTTPHATEVPSARGAPAMRVYQDPVTGRFGPPPAAPAAPSQAGGLQAQAALQQGSSGLVEVPSPHGGVVVDLQGRFNSYVMATVTPEGGVTAACIEHRGAP